MKQKQTYEPMNDEKYFFLEKYTNNLIKSMKILDIELF